MKIKELRQKTKEEIAALLKENREKLRKIRFDLASKKIKNVSEVKVLKKDIARILTLIKQEKATI